jgi:hypothetical protein
VPEGLPFPAGYSSPILPENTNDAKQELGDGAAVPDLKLVRRVTVVTEDVFGPMQSLSGTCRRNFGQPGKKTGHEQIRR